MNQAQKTIRVLSIQCGIDTEPPMTAVLGDSVDVVTVRSLDSAKRLLADDRFDYAIASPEVLSHLQMVTEHPAGADRHDGLGQGVAIIDESGELLWANSKLLSFPEEIRRFVNQVCVELFPATDVGRPLEASQHKGHRFTRTTSNDATYELMVTPILSIDRPMTQMVAVVTDVTRARRQKERLEAIDHAGRDLMRMDAEQVSHMQTGERLSLLDQKITRYLRDLMYFDHFSIHVLDKKTNKLELVVCSGLPEAVQRIDLFALNHGNGITGFVASEGHSYICPDVSKDPHYLQGLEGARSSLTVPLRLNDEIIGVLNVESDDVDAFDASDRELAEVFGRDIATVLHILDLLVTERYATTGRLGSDVMAEITEPVNDILTDVENLVEDYIGHDDLRHRLNKITTNAVAIRDAIKNVTSPRRGVIGRHPTGVRRNDPVLTGKKLLIADDEAMIRETVHDVLVSYGCEVSVADDGESAIELIGNQSFDLVLCDIRMPGRTGYDVFAAAKDANKDTPVILMTGFGYDPNHSIVRARREGLSAVLFKPFKVDQLLGEIRGALRLPSA